ncbi:hypothetical protein GGR56DRAFT_529429 [Xylariaceae sp. FL0804]|nr:hypothetical protein GGR56DRAFT_529429 [Xylariaceae sp. FL0804]
MASSGLHIAVVGTLDTKMAEFVWLCSQILLCEPSTTVILIDAGRAEVTDDLITIKQSEVLQASGYDGSRGPLQSLPRGEIIRIMSTGVSRTTRRLLDEGRLQGVIALGGSGGTSIAAAAMRELPLTLPKLIVSTVASGDTSSYVAESDITMMYSVVDIAGLNEMLAAVINNAAGAIVGMARAHAARSAAVAAAAAAASPEASWAKKKKKGIGITMFGVTTPAVDAARAWLDRRGGEFEVYVFHATGAGGRAMERLVAEGRLAAVLDLTTTELADELAGGVFSAGPGRLTAAARAGLPQIVSVGALDMVNFGPRDTVPAEYLPLRQQQEQQEQQQDEEEHEERQQQQQQQQQRLLLEHNPSVTLMRTSPRECAALGGRLASRLRANCARPDLTEVWLPLRGVSAIAVEGQPFHDRAADEALFGAVREGLAGSGIRVREADAAINDRSWAEEAAQRLSELLEQASA